MAKMKIRITQPGIYGAKGMIEVGTETLVSGEIPAGWKGKYVVVSEEAENAEPVTNQQVVTKEDDAPNLDDMTKDEMLEFAKSKELEVDGRWSKDKLREFLVEAVTAPQTNA